MFSVFQNTLLSDHKLQSGTLTLSGGCRAILCFAITLVLLASTLLAAEKKMVVRVDLSSTSAREIQELLRTHPDILGWGDDWADVLVSEEGIDALTDYGLKSEMKISDTKAYEQDLRDRDYFDYFHDYQEIVDEINAAEQNYPAIVKLYDIGDGWEKTQGLADRDIWAVKISDNVETYEREEPEILIMVNMHAREIITPEIAMHLIHYLTSNYGTDPRITSLVDERQIWIVPTQNPDGLDHVHQVDIWWRKNRRDNGDGTYGVDLNRNYGYMWGYDDIGSSPNTDSETYRGTGPFSEPESQAIRDFTEAHNFVLNLSFHSYGNWWLYPWGYVAENTPDDEIFVAIADSCVAYNGYEPGNSASGVIYATNGGTDDWFYGEQTTKYKVFGFTPEVGGGNDGFHPDTTRVEALIMENLGANLYIIEAAEEYSPRPVIVHNPLVDTEDLTGPYHVVATITPSVWPIDESTPLLHYSWEGGDFESVSLLPTGQPDEFEAFLPGPGESGHYGYYISASDSIPREGVAPFGAPDSLFAFAVGLDPIPPVIVHSPLGNQSILAAPYLLLAEVTDNIGIDTVWAEYRVNQGQTVEEPMLPQGDDVYTGLIDPNDPQSGDTIEYRIIAKDAAASQNTTTHPEDGFHTFDVLEGYSFDFEPNDGGFSASPGGDWEWGDPSSGPDVSHSGQNAWATGLSGQYSDDSNSTLDTPPLSLVNVTEATFSFWHWYRFEYGDGTYWDGGNVKISTDNGETFQLIYPEGGYDGVLTNPANPMVGEPVFGGPASNGNFWHQETFDLSEFVNRTIVIRFHFGSDAFVTDLGWYIDDLFLPTPQSGVPLFTRTTELPSTADTLGPYVVTSEVTDDEGITAVTLRYRTLGGLFRQAPMQLIEGFTYSGEIPGQVYETTVSYYLSALDTDSNERSDPPGAPDSLYSFLVTESLQQLGPLPTSLSFSADQGESVSDTLIISNLGLVDLQFTLTDKEIIDPGSGTGDVITDVVGDAPSGSPDLVGLRTENIEDAIVLEILFAPGWPETTLAIVSLDLDQDASTGTMPPGLGVGYPYHDVGSEVEILFDPADINELGEPSAIVLTSDGQTFLGAVPLTIDSNGTKATFPFDLLYGDDGNMNVCMLSVSDFNNLSDTDFAPEFGHGVIGEGGDAFWLSETPNQETVPGESSVFVTINANASYLPSGIHEAQLFVSTNDPVNPNWTIDITFEVGAAPASEPKPTPTQLTLSVGPNPFRETAIISLGLPKDGKVTVRVYDLLGRRVNTLLNNTLNSGWHMLKWHGRSSQGREVASGIYFCRTETPAGAKTIRLVKTK